MRNKNHMKPVAALALLVCSGYACAAGFQLNEQNASGLANAYAGSASVAEDAGTVFTNPAGLSHLKGNQVSVGVAVVQPSFQFTNGQSSVGTLANAGSGGDAGHTAAVPNAYLAYQLNKDVSLGVGLSAPFGLSTEYSDPWQGGAQSLRFAVTTYNLNPSFSYKVSPALSVGGGVSWQQMDASYKRIVAVNAVPAAGLSAANALNSRSQMDLNGDAWGWNVGALYEADAATRYGVSYRSRVEQKLKGRAVVTGPFAPANAALSSDVKADLTLPDMLILSVTRDINERVQLLGDFSWTGWSSIPQLDVIRTSGPLNGKVAQSLNTDFRDTYRLAVGANYKYRPDLTLKMGLAFDQTPVKGADSRMVSLPDNDRIVLAGGAQWKLSGGSILDLGLSYVYIDKTSINKTETNQGTVNGTYDGSAWLLGVQYSVPF